MNFHRQINYKMIGPIYIYKLAIFVNAVLLMNFIASVLPDFKDGMREWLDDADHLNRASCRQPPSDERACLAGSPLDTI
jgi:hypothetical protein